MFVSLQVDPNPQPYTNIRPRCMTCWTVRDDFLTQTQLNSSIANATMMMVDDWTEARGLDWSVCPLLKRLAQTLKRLVHKGGPGGLSVSLSAPIAETPLNRCLLSRALTNTHTHSHTWLTAPIRGTFWRWEPPLEDWKQTLIQDEKRKKSNGRKKKRTKNFILNVSGLPTGPYGGTIGRPSPNRGAHTRENKKPACVCVL